MSEILVLCGGIGTGTHRAQTVIILDVAAPKRSAERVNLRISEITAAMLADIPPRLIDLIEIAAYVYSADQFARREGPTMRGMGSDWRRRFRFRIPVRQHEFWDRSDVKDRLAETLSFLSDDTYKFEFERAAHPQEIKSYLDLDGAEGAPAGFSPDRVALFSGGLDSLAGAAGALIGRRERVALVSHHASNMIQSRQLDLVGALRSRLPGGQLFHMDVRITKGKEEARDFTQRTRSFVFATLAFVIAHMFGRNEITFYENGIVSLNLPLARHILSTRATRTTHPRVLADFASLFGMLVAHPVRVVNPFFWQTKTEVVRRLAEFGIADLIGRTFSCSRVRESTSTGKHCGACTQCLERRFAVLAAGLEHHDPKDRYAVDLLIGAREPGPDITLAQSFVLTAQRFAAMTPSAFFAHYGEAFRALRHLDGNMDENATALYELHRRHGSAVTGVINNEIGSKATVAEIHALPRTSLLSLIQAPFGSPAPIRDLVESEPTAAEQAEALKEPSRLQQPIRLAIDRKSKRAIIAGELVITGAPFRLIDALANQYLQDWREGRQAADYEFVEQKALAKQLKLSPQGLRQQIGRVRNFLTKEALMRLNAVLEQNDIVESVRWEGYRLNPQINITPLDGRNATTELDVTTFSGMSQLRS